MKSKLSLKTVRIIGGKWRGRKLYFLVKEGLRPTKDMVRETLFNWLAPVIENRICLDLFAGSGALGFEALSRGAQSVVMVDREKAVIATLKENATRLNATAIDFLCVEVPARFLKHYARRFDLVFLDPPFHKNLIATTCAWLDASEIILPQALIYIEAEKSCDIAAVIPKNWQIKKHKFSGDMQYCLVVTN